MQAFFEGAASALATSPSAGPQTAAAAEVSMELATRLVEQHLSTSTRVLSSIGWGPAVDAVAMVAAIEGLASTLSMDTVPLSPTQ